MKRKILFVAPLAIAALVAVSAGASGSTSAVRSVRIAITERDCFACLSHNGTFSLAPLKTGVVELDKGSFTYVAGNPKIVYRDGQLLEIVNGTDTLNGKNGKIVIRWRVESVSAGAGNEIGIGTWTIVKGTGAYEHLRGSGRLGVMFPAPPARNLSAQYEGFVHL